MNFNLDFLMRALKAPGLGLHTVSTGSDRAKAVLKKMGLDPLFWENELKKNLNRIIDSNEICVIGIPSDNGAGIMRGANHGPLAIRESILDEKKTWVDLGDVFTIPHFLTDEMLSEGQIKKSQNSIWNGENYPVSPLTILEKCLDEIFALNPKTKIFLLGGDHSCSMPFFNALKKIHGDFGILHIDAHTDLLDSRLGVDVCFATWAYHAVKQLPDQRMFQLGIRASTKDQNHWENIYPIKQMWAKDANRLSSKDIANQISDYFKKSNLTKIYLSNDIDGTDSEFAPSCGTPEKNGLSKLKLLEVFKFLKKESDFEWIGADLMEVAPLVGSETDREKTLETAREYFKETISILS